MANGIRDLLLFFAFSGVPIVSFWLQDYPDTPFYLGMLTIFLLMLLWLQQYHPEKQFSKLLEYDENLTFESFLWIGTGVVITYIVASVIVSQFTQSVIYVPIHNLELTYFQFQVSPFWNNVLFQLVLVAPAEELCKLCLHIAFYMRLKSSFSEPVARFSSIGIPIFFWSLLHVYRAYVGPNMITLLIAAFVGGIIIFATMYKTQSLMSAILTHAGYNILIIYITSMQVGAP